ncbi:hypothetical protein VNI00_017331 [Paramarasmius palmivorus]|uniref:Uncharacterized protein n=1 Tax=Paramarasmius palmivorus TaxID=297713 RepID=A0AAW0B8K5_9AGAR
MANSDTETSLVDIEGADADTSIESNDMIPETKGPFHPWLHRERDSARTTDPLFSDGTELLGRVGRGIQGQHVAVVGRGRGNVPGGITAVIRGTGLDGNRGTGRGHGVIIPARGAPPIRSHRGSMPGRAQAHHPHGGSRGAGCGQVGKCILSA